MKNTLSLIREITVHLWRAGLIPKNPRELYCILRAWWECGPSFAFLGRYSALRFPGSIAIRDEKGTLSFAELQKEVDKLALHFRGRYGLSEGKRVGVKLPNGRGFVIVLLALARLGVHILPLDPKLGEWKLNEILEEQRLDYIITDEDLEMLLEPASPDRLPSVRKPGQLIVLTSGSTGVSKGIKRKPGLTELLPVTAGLLRDLPFQQHGPMILAIPLYHGYGLASLALSLALAAPLILHENYKVENLLDSLPKSELALLISVPTLLWRWLEKGESKSQLRAVISGSAPLASSLCEDLLRKLGPIVYNLYGSTECGLIALATPEMLARSPGCVGRPLPGNHLRLESENEQGLGVLSVKGPLVLGGDSEGWRSTGDLARFDETGLLSICGRSDEMIVSGGENVYPFELENALRTIAEVADQAVLVVDDEEFGQRLVAAVVLHGDLSEAELKEILAQRLERHKMPRSIHLLLELPKNALGKVDRRALREMVGQ